MKTLHLVLTGKGGCGKSYVAANLAQWVEKTYGNLLAYDTDNENPTFSQYKSLKVTHVPLLDSKRVLIRSRLDSLFNTLAELDDVSVVVDNGASSFSPLLGYLLETSMTDVLKELGWRVVVHTIIAGGSAFHETVQDFKEVTVLGCEIVIWLNEFWSEHIGFSAGEPFIESKYFAENSSLVSGIVLLPRWSDDLYGRDIQELQRKRQTVDEALLDTEFQFTSKLRIKKVFSDICSKLNASGV